MNILWLLITPAPLWYPLKIYGQIYCRIWEKVWGITGVETPLTPDEPGAGQPDVLDGGAGVDGIELIANEGITVQSLRGIERPNVIRFTITTIVNGASSRSELQRHA